MTKKKEILTISENLNSLFLNEKVHKKRNDELLTIERALTIVIRQLIVSGYRERTLNDYKCYVNHYCEITGIKHLDNITNESIYKWLESMNVSSQTRLTRLKCFKAFLSHCYNNGWYESMFWKSIKIRVDNNLKEGATERDVNLLLSVLDLGNFVQIRDATAALLMFKTGIRINTLVQLKNTHVDLDANLLRLDGSIMKNHKELLLPFDEVLHRLLSVLMKQNDLIRREYKQNNNFVFITVRGKITVSSPTNNSIQKQLKKYSTTYGIKNINPHGLRRGFAKSLLNKGANIAVISKALGHSNLAVTTQYLHLDKEEVEKSLRRFL